MKIKKRNNFLFSLHTCLIFFLLVIAFLTYRNLFQTYFQQDEWHNFGYQILRDQNYLNYLRFNGLEYLFGSGRPLTMAINFILFGIAGPSVITYSIFAIVVHTINALLVYYLMNSITKSKLAAFISAAFFLVSSSSVQAVTWFGTITGTLPCMFFALLSLIWFIRYLQKPEKKSNFYIALVMLIVSVMFRESSIFLFIFYPFFEFLVQSKKRSILYFLKRYWFLILFIIIFIGRFIPFFFQKDTSTYMNINSGGKSFLETIISNAVFYPLETFSQTFFYPKTIYTITHFFINTQTPNLSGNDSVEQTIGAQFISFILSILLFVLLGFMYFITAKKKNKYYQYFLIFLLFILFSVLPQIIIQRGSAFLESRYMYFPSVGGGLLLGLTLLFIYQSLLQIINKKYVKLFLTFCLLFTAITFLIYHYNSIQQDINFHILLGQQRKSILTTIFNTYPQINKKTIFFTESDEYDYGPASPTMPFQSGFGQMLIVHYSYEKQISNYFNNDDFLWGIHDEGYKEIGNQGFGYFSNYQKLIALIKSKRLSPNSVIAFSWKKGKLKDITVEIRNKITRDESQT